MLLTIDAGNTQTVVGLYEHPRTNGVDAADGLIDHWRLATNAERTADELAVTFQGLLGFHEISWEDDIGGVAISSGVPRLSAALREMAERFGQSRDRLGRLDEMAKSMDEIIENLDAGALDDETLERQRNVYNRMLDFQKSLQHQDFENRRRSQQADELAGRAPDPLDTRIRDRAGDEARWERFKNEWYPPGFRALVKEYFEAVTRPDGKTQ